jgi:hypothetical protein
MRWLGIASLFRQTLLLLKRAPPRSGAASSYFTRADSFEWAQGHERAKSTYPDKPTRLCRAGAQSIGVASSSSPPRQPSTGEATARSFSLNPTAPTLLGSYRSAVGRVAFPRPWQQNWGSPSHFSLAPRLFVRRGHEKKTPTCDQLCFIGHRSRRPSIFLDIRGCVNFSSSFQAYLDPYSQFLIGQEKWRRVFSFLRIVFLACLKRVTLIKTFPTISYALDKPILASGALSSSTNGLGNSL